MHQVQVATLKKCEYTTAVAKIPLTVSQTAPNTMRKACSVSVYITAVKPPKMYTYSHSSVELYSQNVLIHVVNHVLQRKLTCTCDCEDSHYSNEDYNTKVYVPAQGLLDKQSTSIEIHLKQNIFKVEESVIK